MFNLSEIYEKALGGQAADAIAKQFGLTVENTQAAVEALLPAFSMGLNKTAKSAPKMADFLGLFTAHTPFAKAFDNAADAFSYDSIYAGTEAMKKIFGSDATANLVAQQAATVAGVQAEVLQRVMPALSAMLMGGIFKEGLAGDNPMAAMTAQLSKAGLMPQSWLQANPFADAFAKLSEMFAKSQRQHASNPFAAVPGMEHISAMARQAMAVSPMLELNPFLKAAASVDPSVLFGNAPESDAPNANPTLGQQAADAWTRTFGEMFVAGQKASDDYLAQLSKTLGGK